MSFDICVRCGASSADKARIDTLETQLANERRETIGVRAVLAKAQKDAENAIFLLAAERKTTGPLGECPRTADDVPFAMNANLWSLNDGEVLPGGVLEISDPDDQHPEDYPEGQRWRVLLRDEEGGEEELWNGQLYSTQEAAEAAREKQ